MRMSPLSTECNTQEHESNETFSLWRPEPTKADSTISVSTCFVSWSRLRAINNNNKSNSKTQMTNATLTSTTTTTTGSKLLEEYNCTNSVRSSSAGSFCAAPLVMSCLRRLLRRERGRGDNRCEDEMKSTSSKFSSSGCCFGEDEVAVMKFSAATQQVHATGRTREIVPSYSSLRL